MTNQHAIEVIDQLDDSQQQSLIDEVSSSEAYFIYLTTTSPDDSSDTKLTNYLIDLVSTYDEPYDELKILALMINNAIDYSAADSLFYNYNYKVLTIDEADYEVTLHAQNSLEDVLVDISDHLHRYFDTELYISDYKSEDYGQILAYSDGIEHEVTIADTTYYIYNCS